MGLRRTFGRVSIRRADYWLVEDGDFNEDDYDTMYVSIRRADYWLVEAHTKRGLFNQIRVSIRRADYWLVEGKWYPESNQLLGMFQSAGRIIGWLKFLNPQRSPVRQNVSIRRADYWLVEAIIATLRAAIENVFQSAGRIIGWLKSTSSASISVIVSCFNPPGGLLVG